VPRAAENRQFSPRRLRSVDATEAARLHQTVAGNAVVAGGLRAYTARAVMPPIKRLPGAAGSVPARTGECGTHVGPPLVAFSPEVASIEFASFEGRRAFPACSIRAARPYVEGF
jgi:hypothetical protein